MYENATFLELTVRNPPPSLSIHGVLARRTTPSVSAEGSLPEASSADLTYMLANATCTGFPGRCQMRAIVLTIRLTLCVAISVLAQDHAKVDPEHVKVVAEND